MVTLFTLAACGLQQNPSLTRDQATVDYDVLLNMSGDPVSYQKEVLPVLENRCMVCHGCYDAPCQLKLTSREGVIRGASKATVYNGSRLVAADPTRLFIDAQGTDAWRQKGFFPVINEGEPDHRTNLQDSVMYRLLRLKQLHPQPRVGMLPDSFDLGLDRRQECPTIGQFDNYAQKRTMWGMPYAMPNLSEYEYRVLVRWLAQGAPFDVMPGVPDTTLPQIERWEAFLNGDSNKQQLVSRYLYEHLFLAHLHFDGTDTREFYRLVRSATPPGQPIEELATVRPYNDPGTAPFYYRLWRYPASIVDKNHVVYELSDARLQRFRELFIEPAYSVSELPGYSSEVASNPFRVFAPIPPVSRYWFLLDDARFFIEGFIKGPVCRGQIALNVIEDNFWVFFFDTDKELFTISPNFLERNAEYLRLPQDGGKGMLRQLGDWRGFWRMQQQYISDKQAMFSSKRQYTLDEAMDFIWDGNGTNPNGALTVFRHFDSASVVWGLIGDYPETAWVIDYPLFERIHYLLVAGFNVFGNAGHQLVTRLYMDFLRMEGEDHFLAFMPVSDRQRIRGGWYKGLREENSRLFEKANDWLQVETVQGYTTDDPQREFYRRLEKHLAAVARLDRDLDRCSHDDCAPAGLMDAGRQVDRAMRRISTLGGLQLRVFPDITFVRVRTGEPGSDLGYTLIRNKAYRNVSSFLSDTSQRDSEDQELDTLTVVSWLEGSYPNMFFVVDIADIDVFADRYLAIRDRNDYERFVALYGIRRTNPEFWQTADWFQALYAREQPILSGLFDLNRYRNR